MPERCFSVFPLTDSQHTRWEGTAACRPAAGDPMSSSGLREHTDTHGIHLFTLTHIQTFLKIFILWV